MAALRSGVNQVRGIYLGGTSVQKMYLGSSEVFPNNVPGESADFTVGITPTDTGCSLTMTSALTGGIYYWYISQNPTPPDVADIRSGTGAIAAGSLQVIIFARAAIGAQTLTPETGYYLHSIYDTGQNDISVQSTSFSTTAVDTEVPRLSSAQLTATGLTTLTGAVTTTVSGGMVYWALYTSASPQSKANIESGNGASAHDALYINTSGSQNISAITNLTTGQNYYLHSFHRSSSGQESTVVVSGAENPRYVEVPILTSVEIKETGFTSATIACNTSDGTGTLWWAVVAAGQTPSVSQIKSGSTALASGTFAPPNGHNTADVNSLPRATEMTLFVVQENSYGNRSLRVEATETTTTQGSDVESGSSVLTNWKFDSNLTGWQTVPDTPDSTRGVVWVNTGGNGAVRLSRNGATPRISQEVIGLTNGTYSLTFDLFEATNGGRARFLCRNGANTKYIAQAQFGSPGTHTIPNIVVTDGGISLAIICDTGTNSTVVIDNIQLKM